jgi:hypothetical protein
MTCPHANLPRNLWVNRCTTELAALYGLLLAPVLGEMSLAEAVDWAERLWENTGAAEPEQAARHAVADLVHLSRADDQQGLAAS